MADELEQSVKQLNQSNPSQETEQAFLAEEDARLADVDPTP
jgi:hypothetical protein